MFGDNYVCVVRWIERYNYCLQFICVGNSLVTLMCHLFNVCGLIHHYQLDMVKLHRFLGKLAEDFCCYVCLLFQQ